MTVTDYVDSHLRKSLEAAVTECRNALADYRSGILDKRELRDALFQAGLVEHAGQAWLLDLQASRWWRYDGVVVDASAAALTNVGLDRLRAVIDELADESARGGAR